VSTAPTSRAPAFAFAKSLFFDVGLAGGRDQHSSGRHRGIGGVMISTGIGIPVS
jgi:hypothetical protein